MAKQVFEIGEWILNGKFYLNEKCYGGPQRVTRNSGFPSRPFRLDDTPTEPDLAHPIATISQRMRDKKVVRTRRVQLVLYDHPVNEDSDARSKGKAEGRGDSTRRLF